MAITVYIHSNDHSVLEIPEDDDHLLLGVPVNTEDTLTNSNPQLSVDERMVLLDELADKFMEYVGPDFPPLSDYAVSREGIYADHPKL